MWRPGNWEGAEGLGKKGAKIYEAGADAMHKADVNFIRLFHSEVYFLLQERMGTEEFEAWIK